MVVNMSENNPVEFAKAIADATRQQIMRVCCCNWCSVTELVEKSGVSQPTVSHHLAILRDAGLVNVRHEGKQSFYSSTRTGWWRAAANSWRYSHRKPKRRQHSMRVWLNASPFFCRDISMFINVSNCRPAENPSEGR